MSPRCTQTTGSCSKKSLITSLGGICNTFAILIYIIQLMSNVTDFNLIGRNIDARLVCQLEVFFSVRRPHPRRGQKHTLLLDEGLCKRVSMEDLGNNCFIGVWRVVRYK